MEVALFRSVGTVNYLHKEGYGYRLVVDVDPELVRYYRALIPKWIKTNTQMYDPHISVVRHEVPVVMEAWGTHQGESVEFHYSNIIHQGTVYLWLNVFSTALEDLRVELGLPISSPYTVPPDGFSKCFHCTIGNTKELACQS